MQINVTIDAGLGNTAVEEYLARQLAILVEQAVSPVVRFEVPVEPAPRSSREKEYTTDPARIVELLEEAIRMRAPVDITYEAIDQNTFTRRDFSPSAMRRAAGPVVERRRVAAVGRPLIVTGYCHAREEARTFRLSGIRALEVR